MGVVNPYLLKTLCIVLIISLFVVISFVLYDILFSDYPGDWSMIVFLTFLSVPVFIYFSTIRYCNMIIRGVVPGNRKSTVAFFLIMSIVGLLFSITALIASFIGLYSASKEDGFTLLNRSTTNIVLLFMDFIYAILGPVVFFLQLRIRKQLFFRKENSIDWLIDSIGSEHSYHE